MKLSFLIFLIGSITLILLSSCGRKIMDPYEVKEIQDRCVSNGGNFVKVFNPDGTVNRITCLEHNYGVNK